MLKPLAVTGVLCAAGLFLAPAAHATDADFVTHVKGLGITASTDAKLAQIGHLICADIAPGGGYTRESEAKDLVAHSEKGNPGNGISLADARQEIAFAISDICPNEANVA